MDERTEGSGESNHESGSRCDPVRLSLAVAAFITLRLGAGIACAGPFDFSPSDFEIMNADGTQVIGHGHYEVTPDGKGNATALGEDHFNDGQYDLERDVLELRGDNQVPRLITFEHTFFNANGMLQREGKANFQTGLTSCMQYENGQPVVRSMMLSFPADTFAGAAIIIALKGDLLRGKKNGLVLHDFNCMPGPKILKVEAYPQPPSGWAHFPGKVVRVDIKPDFGWLSFVAALFVPEIRTWFSPSDEWRFVGAKFTRFYKGPEIILARVPKTR